jgi:hypothetical protein
LAATSSASSIDDQFLTNIDLTAHQAAVFVVEAASAYCPGFLDQIAA